MNRTEQAAYAAKHKLGLEADRKAMHALVEHGTIRAAAESLGVHRSSFHKRITRLEFEIVKHQKADLSRVKELEAIIKMQEAKIEALAKGRYQIPNVTIAASSTEGFCRAIIPDTHGCLIDSLAWAAVLSDLEQLQPEEIVFTGDHLDCGGFLAQHHTLGYVADTEYTFQDDIDAANDMLDQIGAICGRSRKHYLEGNHERRIETWCVTQALRNGPDAAFLRNLVGTEKVLHLEDRGINYYRQGIYYDGCKIPATIKLGKCYFTHGSSSAKHTASTMLSKFGSNVVFGHVHRSQEDSKATVDRGIIRAWCPGCLCGLQPRWQHTNPTEWNHGYGVQFVQESGDFLHLNVPIIDGVSYLSDFLSRI